MPIELVFWTVLHHQLLVVKNLSLSSLFYSFIFSLSNFFFTVSYFCPFFFFYLVLISKVPQECKCAATMHAYLWFHVQSWFVRNLYSVMYNIMWIEISKGWVCDVLKVSIMCLLHFSVRQGNPYKSFSKVYFINHADIYIYI